MPTKTKSTRKFEALLLSRTITSVQTTTTEDSCGLVSMELTLDNGKKVLVCSGTRGATAYDRDTVSVYEVD